MNRLAVVHLVGDQQGLPEDTRLLIGYLREACESRSESNTP